MVALICAMRQFGGDMAKNDSKEERAARLAENLRANLRRRKAQARETNTKDSDSENTAKD